MSFCGALASAPSGARSCFAGRPVSRPLARLAPVRATNLPAEVTKVVPLGKRVLVAVGEAEEKSAGGILLPSTAQKKPTKGSVVDAGTATLLKKGAQVVYSKYAGTEITLQSADYVILKEEDVIGELAADADISALSPLQDRLLIRVAEAADTTAGGVFLTEASKDQPTLGEVVAAGPGRAPEEDDSSAASLPAGAPRRKTPPPAPMAAVGSTVLYQRYSGTEFTGEGDVKYIVIRNHDVLATVA